MPISDREGRERVYGGQTQAERQAKRQRQFLEAGLQVFGTAGYREATVRQLCRQAQLTDRYFYEAFGSTEDLLVAVYLECIRGLRDRVIRRVLEADAKHPEQLVRGALDGFFEAVQDARLARVVWLEVRGVSPRVDQIYTGSQREFAKLLIQLAQRMHPQLDETNPLHRMTTIGLIGALSESARQWMLREYHEPRELMVEAAATILLAVSDGWARKGGDM
ncbi:MAG: TetR/AcrR family transcriptional regulator [Myxococcales bacterium]